MNLAFTHTGKRFFFITLVLEGRPEALSDLVDEKSRPRLTALGEIVKAAFVAVHQVWPAATLSDFVIMPDHIHFILIVNYEVAPNFNPLFFSHILMTAIEQGWANHHGQGSGAPNQSVPHLGQDSGVPEPPRVLIHSQTAAPSPRCSASCSKAKLLLRFCFSRIGFLFARLIRLESTGIPTINSPQALPPFFTF